MSQNREFHSFCHRYSTFASACESGSGSAWGTLVLVVLGGVVQEAHPQAAQPHGLLRQSMLQCKGIAPVHLSRLPLLPRSHQSRSTCQRLYWHMLQTGRSANGSLLLQTMKAARSYMTISWGGSILGPKLTAPTGLTWILTLDVNTKSTMDFCGCRAASAAVPYTALRWAECTL